MRRALGAVLGALAGLAFSTMGLIDTSNGFIVDSLAGNEATPVVIAVGVAIGAVVGLTVLWRFPLAILGAIIGLVAGMWLRDHASLTYVQPPWVFFLLFGLPGIGAAGGYLLHLPRTTWARHPTEGAAVISLAAATVGYIAASFIWTSVTHDPSCDPIPQPDGSVIFQLCADSGSPLWIGVMATLLGVLAGSVTYKKLNQSNASGSEVDASTSGHLPRE